MQDETIIRLFPNLRRSWSQQGIQAEVGVSGRNAQRTLSCAMNLRTGAIVAQVQQRNNQQGFQTLLWAVRRRYKALPVYMLLDGFSAHRAKATIRLASQLSITLIELPKQCPELNAVDHLWRHVKADISANCQYPSIDNHAKAALQYVKDLSPKQRLTKAAVYANSFWLKNIL
jgi:transposase